MSITIWNGIRGYVGDMNKERDMTINELILILDNMIAGNPHLKDSEIRISAEGADLGIITKIDVLRNNETTVFYENRMHSGDMLEDKDYTYLTAEY